MSDLKSSTASLPTADPQAALSVTETAQDVVDQVPQFVELLPEVLKPYWQFVQQYPAGEALAIMLVFWAGAYLIRRYVIRLIENLSKRTKSDLDDAIISEIRGPIFSSTLWFGVIVATQSAGFTDGAYRFITPIALSMILLALTRMALSVSGKLITTLSRDQVRFRKLDIRTEPLLIITSKIVLMLISAYMVLMVWGINPVGLLASAGIVGIAVGFAAKDTLANLFSGVFILADRPYKLGDFVILDSGERGQVTHIGIRSTRLLTRDDIEVTVPNGVIGNAKIVNESGGSHTAMRIRLDVQCAYDADLDEVERLLMELAENEPEINVHPTPRVRVRGFRDSGIDVQLMGWINEPADRGRITHIMFKKIHAAFREHELEIPFPKRDITIKHEES
ncbi:mechanosensitive ion channel family protein [Arenicella xantha]|uniref:Small-conductance mechanosensitive channel n=1 Tax=Arenicella xantha TaxID=644221 RepID=A0A395JSJ5_9GAMM|nr:mechanosensitive ion channel family protein [Arenicella xantha]RBP53322.1 small-conductance mechanosensitive channel [Arenicella xantha]